MHRNDNFIFAFLVHAICCVLKDVIEGDRRLEVEGYWLRIEYLGVAFRKGAVRGHRVIIIRGRGQSETQSPWFILGYSVEATETR